MSKFELSLKPTYAADWTLVDAIRELFQNALDQQTKQSDNDMFAHYDGVHMLQIGNKKSVLEAESLLLGATTKADDEETIGQFGEGYKIATLVLLRLGKTIKFYNYGKKEIWEPGFEMSVKYGRTEILVFRTKKFRWTKVPDNNLTIVIDGITPEEYEAIRESNLHLQDMNEQSIETTSEGQILLDMKYAGQVFVSGLYVTTLNTLKYGYNFKPQYLPLGRDRNMVRSIDIGWETSKMWQEVGGDVMLHLAQTGAYDVSYVKNVTPNIQVTSMTAVVEKAQEAFTATYGERAIPVTNQFEADQVRIDYEDAEPIIVNETHKHILTNSGKSYVPAKAIFKEAPRFDPDSALDRLSKWTKKAKYHLPRDLSRELDAIISLLSAEGEIKNEKQ